MKRKLLFSAFLSTTILANASKNDIKYTKSIQSFEQETINSIEYIDYETSINLYNLVKVKQLELKQMDKIKVGESYTFTDEETNIEHVVTITGIMSDDDIRKENERMEDVWGDYGVCIMEHEVTWFTAEFEPPMSDEDDELAQLRDSQYYKSFSETSQIANWIVEQNNI